MVLDRYILRLWLTPFLASLAIVTGVLLIGRALRVLGLVVDSGIEWSIMLTLLAAILPYFLVLTLPIAFFFAMQATIIRLHQDSELDALRSAGISYARTFRSLFVVGLLLWGLLSYTAMEWMPQGQKAFQGLLYAIQKVKAAPGFEPQRFNHDLEHFTVYVEGEDDQGQLHGFMLEDNRPGGPVMYLAQTAKFERGANQLRFILYKGIRLEGSGEKMRVLAFGQYEVSIAVAGLGLIRVPQWHSRIFEMNMKELRNVRKLQDTPEAAAEWHRRLILPTTVMLLILFALPMSIEPKRSGKAGAYMMGILAILGVYNVQILLHQQVSAGHLPWWSMWAGQLGMVAIGVELTRRAALDHLPSLLMQIGEMFYLIHQRIQHWLAERMGKS